MKKSISIFSTVLMTFGLSAFGIINWSGALTDQGEISNSNTNISTIEPVNINKPIEIDLVYNVDSRFMTTISKEKLHKATTVLDIVPKEAEWSKVSFSKMKIAILQDDDEIYALGDDEVLNAVQIELLQSADYSTNFYINARGTNKDGGQDGLNEIGQKEYDLSYYLTVIPEKESSYMDGRDVLINYLRENSKEKVAKIKEDKLQPGRVSFTVTKEGIIANVKLISTSGYPTVDETLLDLVRNIPGKWQPATNLEGEKVDQELVLFFGLLGC